MKRFTATKEEVGRLDLVLAGFLGVSRTKAKKWIQVGAVLVNDAAVTAHSPVVEGDVISVNEEAMQKPEKSSIIPPLEILYEDEDVLVVNKPAGLLVHKTATSHEPTMVDALLAHFPKIASVGDSPDRPGLVHRLDKDASGVLAVAKTDQAFLFLKRQFAERQTKKHYTVLVEGILSKDHDTITFPIARSKSLGRMAARPTSQEGREAITHYTVLKRFPHHTLLDVVIETGRTHQIRSHMLALGHPVVGDTLYTIRGLKIRKIGRLFLHATSLTFTLPSGEEKTVSAPLPQELEQVLLDIPSL